MTAVCGRLDDRRLSSLTGSATAAAGTQAAESLKTCSSRALVARRTWRFFEAFVGTEDNWLPPDNFQEDPAPVIAHRTSPTNIGLLLLATSSAHDLGYVASLEFVERQELTFATLANWESFTAISSTGTTRGRSSRCTRNTSPLSTAATSPAI